MSVYAFSDAFAILALAVLFIAGVLLLAVATRVWVRTMAETENYRLLRMRVDTQAETLRDAEAAVDELQSHAAERDAGMPTDEEMMAWARAQSHPEFGGERAPGYPEYEGASGEYGTTDNNAMHSTYNGEGGEISPDKLFMDQV